MKIWNVTDVGVVRKGSPNEDTYMSETFEDGSIIAAVFDGMGGANAGEVASNMASGCFRRNFTEQYLKGERDIAGIMISCTKKANAEVFEASSYERDLVGMGTTLVAAYCKENTAILANVGDSRAYLITDAGIRCITNDHSLVSEMVRMGELSQIEARKHPSRNIITRAIGVDPVVKCDTYECPVKEGEYILLCSDGLSDQVSDPEIYYEVYESGHPEEACENLVKVANSRGGSDNVTIVLISF
ncbi:MAG: Stp1/IreP family PP2C-type Ser/Thr phosphatase [Clostridia bacterium]|nr:Stp1/IreP family PP2C-type Ser/Thr phosphatase [Clostridia bacterium]